MIPPICTPSLLDGTGEGHDARSPRVMIEHKLARGLEEFISTIKRLPQWMLFTDRAVPVWTSYGDTDWNDLMTQHLLSSKDSLASRHSWKTDRTLSSRKIN